MESTSPIVLGMPLDIFLLFVSGVFYAVCAWFLWKKLREEKSELTSALFAFLSYQTINMVFMGLEIFTENMVYGRISALAILLGSTYMLKFPLSHFSSWARKVVFMLSLIVALGLFVWFIQTPETEKMLMKFVLWYDLIVNGILVGGTMIIFGLRAVERVYKMKAIGGGAGVISCCVIAGSAFLSGAMLTGAVSSFFAPILILGTLFLKRKN